MRHCFKLCHTPFTSYMTCNNQQYPDIFFQEYNHHVPFLTSCFSMLYKLLYYYFIVHATTIVNLYLLCPKTTSPCRTQCGNADIIIIAKNWSVQLNQQAFYLEMCKLPKILSSESTWHKSVFNLAAIVMQESSIRYQNCLTKLQCISSTKCTHSNQNTAGVYATFTGSSYLFVFNKLYY